MIVAKSEMESITMTRTEVLFTMHAEISRRIFRTMQLGGNTRQLEAMEDEGLISSESRGGRGRDRRNWFLSDEQHAALSFMFGESEALTPAKCETP